MSTGKSDVPSPSHQRQIISKLEAEDESIHVYAVSLNWHHTWQNYVGITRDKCDSVLSCSSGAVSSHGCIFNVDTNQFIAAKEEDKVTRQSSRSYDSTTLECPKKPGPLTMDTNQEEGNVYVDEKIWKQWVKWYGVHPDHQMDRRNWTSDEIQYEICMFNPFSGIIINPTKTFDATEKAGYIEMQLKRIFKIQKHRRSRLWICERSRNSKFQLVLERDKEISQQKGVGNVQDGRDYILALEVCNHDNTTWPTCSPANIKGELSIYDELTEGPKSKDFWENELTTTVDSVFRGITAELKETVGGLVQTTKCITNLKERELSDTKSNLDKQLKSITQVQKTFEDKVKDVIKQEEMLKCEMKRVRKDRDNLESEKGRLAKEMLQMEELNKIAESRVKLDVGGHLFTTSLLTLTKDPHSMLAAMFSGRHSISREADGTFFIDRDGTYFRYILNYLRDGGFKSGALPATAAARSELLAEAEYYQIGNLIKLLSHYDGQEVEIEAESDDHMLPERLISPKKMLRKIVKK